MSYFDDASLVMIPSGYKEDKVYSVKPIDGSGDLDFTRASSATRIGPTGLIEKTRTNLLLQSNQFDTTWIKSNTAVTGGQSGYDGSSDAWLISKSAATALMYQNLTSAAGVNTFSVYVKEGTLNWVAIQISGAASPFSYFDVQNGVIGTNNGIDAKIVSVGSGWYRISITATNTLNSVYIYPAHGDNDLSGTSGNLYIQDAQLEAGLVATSYIETTTTAVTVGSYDNVPRLNYTAGSTSSCPSLLLEPQRTNLVTQSEYINTSSYALTNATITNNSATSPQGVVNANLISITSSGSITSYGTSVGSNSVTFSIFAKQGTTSRFRMREAFYYGTQVVFDLSNGTIISGSGTIENYGNGWYRCSMTQTYTSGQGNLTLTMDSDTNPAMDVYLWGTQFEEGSYPSSYIPTFGATVTRVADAAIKTGISGLLGQTEGVVFLKVGITENNNVTGATKWYFEMRKDANNSFGISSAGGVNPPTRFVTNISGVVTTESEPAIFSDSKIAIKYDSSNFKFFQNGTLYKTVAKNIGGYVEIQFMEGAFSDLKLPLEQFLIFPTALTDAQCIELTTI